MEIDHSLNKKNVNKFIKASDKKVRNIVNSSNLDLHFS